MQHYKKEQCWNRTGITFGEDGGFASFEGGVGHCEDQFVAWLIRWGGHDGAFIRCADIDVDFD